MGCSNPGPFGPAREGISTSRAGTAQMAGAGQDLNVPRDTPAFKEIGRPSAARTGAVATAFTAPSRLPRRITLVTTRREARHRGHAVVMVAAATVAATVAVSGLRSAWDPQDARPAQKTSPDTPRRVPALRPTGVPAVVSPASYTSLMIPHGQVMLDLGAIAGVRGRRPAVRAFARRLVRRQRASLQVLEALSPRFADETPTEEDLTAARLIVDTGEVVRAPSVDTAFLERVLTLEAAAIALGRRVLSGRPDPANAKLVRAMIDAQEAERRAAGRLVDTAGRP